MTLRIAFWGFVVLSLVTLPALGQLRPGEPAAVGMSSAGLDHVAAMLDSEVRQHGLDAASILVARRGTVVLHKGFGHLSGQAGAPAVEPDSVYVVGSITKTVTATAMMILVERGQVSLNEKVSTYLPEFTGGERSKVRVINLLTHTSGLPDQLPENNELRQAHAPLSEFLKHTYTTPLLFAPGTAYSYQSMGILLAATIVEKLSGMSIQDFERKEIFEPLGMTHTSLGTGKFRLADTVQVQVGTETDMQAFRDWGPNSTYWRDLGNPWGALHTTTTDLAILLQTLLNGGTYGRKRLLGPMTVKAMLSDQNTHLNAPWGLGWRLGNSPGMNLGDLLSPRAFGHNGSPGTMEWADPETQVICVVLSSRPLVVDNGLFLRLVSNAVVGSIEK
jgi:CubicO group peptidase (beta-lactamase class C family)